ESIPDKSRKGVGFVSYNVVPPPPIELFLPPKLDLSNSGLEEFQQPEFEGYGPKTSNSVSEDISNEGNPQKEYQGYVDSGCSRHMTGNMSYLSDFEEFDGGYVTFRGGAKGGKITGKGTLKTGISVARTPQQNGVAKRKNKTVIEAAKTMLADSKLPTIFWDEAVNTACYVQNKSDDGFFVRYSLNNKAFRVYNIRTRKVEENLHIRFLENKPIIAGDGPKWLFNIDALTKSMNYVPVVAVTTAPLEATHADLFGDETKSSVQTRRMIKTTSEQGFISAVYEGTHKDLHTCLFACFLSLEEPKKLIKALKDPSWIEVMQEQLLQFKLQQVKQSSMVGFGEMIQYNLTSGLNSFGRKNSGDVDGGLIIRGGVRIGEGVKVA
nr:hypothetical protein [Tanacetum cinerariifolium]